MDENEKLSKLKGYILDFSQIFMILCAPLFNLFQINCIIKVSFYTVCSNLFAQIYNYYFKWARNCLN